MVKPPLRTKSIGFKVSEEEYAQLETAAQAGGCTLGEWCRETVLASDQATKPAGPGGAEAQALMAELVALRAILLNVVYKLGNGEKLTAEEMQRLIDRADSDKLKKARKPGDRRDVHRFSGPFWELDKIRGETETFPLFRAEKPRTSRLSPGLSPVCPRVCPRFVPNEVASSMGERLVIVPWEKKECHLGPTNSVSR